MNVEWLNPSSKHTIIIPVYDIKNLNQKCIINKTPFYCRAVNKQDFFDPYSPQILYIKHDFYKKISKKSADIIQLLDSHFLEIKCIAANSDISFKYCINCEIPFSYGTVCQALINWFSPTVWSPLVFPQSEYRIISLTSAECLLLSYYTSAQSLNQDSLDQITLGQLIKKIDIALIELGINSGLDIYNIRICDFRVIVKKPKSKIISAIDIIKYLVTHTGFRSICRFNYQGPADFILIRPGSWITGYGYLQLTAFFRDNKLIGISQSDLGMGYNPSLYALVTGFSKQIIYDIQKAWENLCQIGKLDYEDVVVTVILFTTRESNSHEIYKSVRVINIEMGYGAWTDVGSKLFTWAELELLTGDPPIIKLMGLNNSP